jgi:hypothetical protein
MHSPLRTAAATATAAAAAALQSAKLQRETGTFGAMDMQLQGCVAVRLNATASASTHQAHQIAAASSGYDNMTAALCCSLSGVQCSYSKTRPSSSHLLYNFSATSACHCHSINHCHWHLFYMRCHLLAHRPSCSLTWKHSEELLASAFLTQSSRCLACVPMPASLCAAPYYVGGTAFSRNPPMPEQVKHAAALFNPTRQNSNTSMSGTAQQSMSC